MEIKKIQGVTIDGKNSAYGGYIYNVKYNPSNGEGLSVVTVTIANETGVYLIDKNYLKNFRGSVKINIGSGLTLSMVPYEFRKENSVSGKILEVDFVDESILYLDKFYIGLRDRIMPHPRVILVGERRKRRVVAMDKSRVFDPYFDPEEDEVRVMEFPELFKDDEEYNEVPEEDEEEDLIEVDDFIDETKVNDVEYTLPHLYEKIKNLKSGGLIGEGQHLLTGGSKEDREALENYWRSYTGTLRQVLSAWCSDLGYVYYWEDGKVHFVDASRENNLNYIENKINSFCSSVNAESENESYTLQGTFTRATNSFLGRDGSLQSSMEDRDEADFLFKSIRIEDIPWTTSADSFINNPQNNFINTIKAAHYGNDYIMSYLAFYEATTDWKQFEYLGRVAFQYREFSMSSPIDRGVLEYCYSRLGSRVDGGVDSYKWVAVKRVDETDLDRFFERYRAVSDFYGRFFSLKMTANFFQKYIPDDTGIVWYDEFTLLKNTILGESLAPVSDLIRDFEKIDLREFFQTGISLAEPGGRGYAIKERETNQEWSPVNSEDIIKIGDVMIIEDSIGGRVPDDTFIIAAPNNVRFEPSSISLPSLSPVEVYARTASAHLVNLVDPKIEWCKTSFSSNFGDSVGAVVEVLHTDISEEQVRAAGLTKRPNPDDHLTKENFDVAHDLYSGKTIMSQTSPYFSKSITTSSLVTDGMPKIGEGLLDLSVSITSDGMKVNYSFGTDLLRVRSPGVFFETIINKKRRDRFIRSSRSLSGKRGTPGASE